MSVKDGKKSGVGDRSIMSVVISFRTDEVNIVYNSRRILVTKFEMVSNQIAVVNVYVPAGSQEFFFLFFWTNLPVLLKVLTWIYFSLWSL